MKLRVISLAAFVCLSVLFGVPHGRADYIVFAPESDGARSSLQFLANYTNPEQQALPADGIYPLGQRMPISGYSSNSSQQLRMINAGFSMDGPHYHGMGDWMMKNWEAAEDAGMKNYFRLRINDYQGSSAWGAVLPQMKTQEGRDNIERQVVAMIDYVQSDPKLNSNIAAWYGYPEEPITRSSTPLWEQRAYLEFVHNIIKAHDNSKRPYYVSERSDSSQYNMIGNQPHQDGVLKQNYLIESNAYGGDDEMRVLMWQWARDQIIAAEQNDASYPSYTGKKRAAITTLEMFRDPSDVSKRTEAWLSKAITHDIYIQLAAGIDGFALYTWSRSSSYSQLTKTMQENIYMDALGQIATEGLGEVFLWGDDRDDLQLDIIDGPETVQWKKYQNWFTAPSIRMRNIQYGDNRYVLLVNSAKEAVQPRLSGFPEGMEILNMLMGTWSGLDSSIAPIMQPLEVRMYKIQEIPEPVTMSLLVLGGLTLLLRRRQR